MSAYRNRNSQPEMNCGDSVCDLSGISAAPPEVDELCKIIKFRSKYTLAQGRRRLAVRFVHRVVRVIDFEVGGAAAIAVLLLNLLANSVVLCGAVLLESVCAFLLVDGVVLRVVHRVANLLVRRSALLLKLGRYDLVNDVVCHSSAFLLGNLN